MYLYIRTYLHKLCIVYTYVRTYVPTYIVPIVNVYTYVRMYTCVYVCINRDWVSPTHATLTSGFSSIVFTNALVKVILLVVSAE